MKSWRIVPKVRFTNYRKLYPQGGENCWKQWVSVSRRWRGRIININVRHFQLSLDFRRNWIADMVEGR